MKILSILFLCSILSLSKSDQIVSNDAENTTKISNHIQRKKLPIFPKNHVKFIVKSHTHYTNEDDVDREEIWTRRPLMVKIVPTTVTRSKKTSLKTTEIVTRKPLMKFRTYTVKMRLNGKDREIQREDRQRKRYSIKSDKARPSKSRIENKELEKVNSVTINENKISKDSIPPEISNGKFSYEEEQDRQEFIFLEKKNEHIEINDLLYASEEDFETSTITLLATKVRRKRNSNIIEEENMGTTVSPLKYTGRDTRLTNDLHFKNINH